MLNFAKIFSFHEKQYIEEVDLLTELVDVTNNEVYIKF